MDFPFCWGSCIFLSRRRSRSSLKPVWGGRAGGWIYLSPHKPPTPRVKADITHLSGNDRAVFHRGLLFLTRFLLSAREGFCRRERLWTRAFVSTPDVQLVCSSVRTGWRAVQLQVQRKSQSGWRLSSVDRRSPILYHPGEKSWNSQRRPPARHQMVEHFVF